MAPGGAILTLSATLSGSAFAHVAGISAAFGAVEVTTQSLAAEFGPRGIRVNCVRGSAMPETRTIRETFAGQAALRDAPMAAVFLASGLTAQMVTVCAGPFPTHV